MNATTPQTAPVEVRARELLAAELRSDGKVCAASRILHPIDAGTAMENAAIRAIEKALATPAPISGDVEAVARAIRVYVASQPEDRQMLPAIQFINNRDDEIAAAALSAIGAGIPGREAWQDIATAPKDHTRILVFSTWPTQAVYVARWIGAPHNGWIRESGGYADRVTHWQPLPEPPQVQP